MSSELYLQMIGLILVGVFFARMILLITEVLCGSDEFLEALAGSMIPAGISAIGVVSALFLIYQPGG